MNGGGAYDLIESVAGTWANWMWPMTWQIAVLVVVLSIVTWLLQFRSAVFLHAVWVLVLVRLMLPPTFAAPTGWAWWVLLESEMKEVADKTGPKEQSSEQVVSVKQPVSSAENVGQAASQMRTADSQAAEIASNPPLDSGTEISTPTGQPDNAHGLDVRATRARSRSWASFLMLGWAGVSGTLLGLLVVGSLRVRRWVNEAEPIDDARLYLLLDECRKLANVKRLVELRNSAACSTPVVVGLFRPVILLPRAVIAELSTEQMRAVLLHELFHIARGDAIVNLFQGVLGALYFFHPLVWWANFQMRSMREDACDELTVTALRGQRKIYGEALVKVTEIFGYASPPLALGVMESKSPAHRRLERILEPDLPRGGSLGWKSLAGIAVLGAVLLPSAGGRERNPMADLPSAANSDAVDVVKPNVAINDVPQATGAVNDQPARPTPKTDQQPVASATRPLTGKPPESSENGPTDPPPSFPKVGAPPTPQVALNNATDPTGEGGFGKAFPDQPVKPQAVTPVEKLPITPLAEGTTPLLRYRWEAGKDYAYTVQIEVDAGNEFEVYGGTPTYAVRKSGRDGTELVFNGRLMQTRRIKDPSRFPIGAPRFNGPYSPFSGVGFSGFAEEHVLHVDDRGNVQSMKGSSQLPHMLGNLSQLTIFPIPDEIRDRWEESSRTSVTLFTDRYPQSMFGPRLGPFGSRDAEERLDAKEKINYTIAGRRGEFYVVRKKYELKSLQTVNEHPRVQLVGDLEIEFDAKHGLPISVDGKFTLAQSTENTTHRSPITISARLLTEAEVTKLREEQAEAAKRKPVDDKTLDDLLAVVRSGDKGKERAAMTRLERVEPTSRQNEVSQILVGFLKDKESFTRQAAARALVPWSTIEQVPTLIEAIGDNYFTVRWAAIEALGRLKDKRAVEPLVEQLRKNDNRLQAANALQQIGAEAEEPVLSLLSESEWQTRWEACKVLKVIATSKSLPALEKAAKDDENIFVRTTADQAVKEIHGRMK